MDKGGPVHPTPPSTPSVTPTAPTGVVCSPAELSHGAVSGRLLLKDDQPAVGSILYLSEYVGPDEAPLVVLDPARHLYAETGEGGAFCFQEVPSGRYALIVWNAVDSLLLDDPNTGYSMAIDVEAGGVTDVGAVYTPVP